jgi:curved DNA-binding protein CbpA
MRVGAWEAQIDLYGELGVARAATREQIRRAHKRLALEHHPDRCAPEGRRGAEARSKRINLAAAVLLDDAARARYDRLREATERAAAPHRRAGTPAPTAPRAEDFWPFVRPTQGPARRVDPPVAWDEAALRPRLAPVHLWVTLGATFAGLVLAIVTFACSSVP